MLISMNPRHERDGLLFAFRCSAAETDVTLPDGREAVIRLDPTNEWYCVIGSGIFAEGFSSDDDAEAWLLDPERSWNAEVCHT